MSLHPLKQALLPRLPDLLAELLPAGKPSGKDFLVGDEHGEPGKSCVISMDGEWGGWWQDFATGNHGDIIDLTIAYCWALDERNWDALRNVFLAEAQAELGAGVENGVDAIITRVSGVLTPLDASQHFVSNHQVAVDGDRATCRCYLHAQHVRKAAAGGRLYLVAGGYEDELVRTPAGWRIGHRRLVVVWTEGNPGVVRGDR